MKLSKTELQMLAEIAKKTKIISIAKALEKSKSQIYRTAKKLAKKGFISVNKGNCVPAKTTHVSLMIQLLGEYPSVIEPLSDSGIKILTALLNPKSIEEITQETGIKRAYVFRKIKQAKAISLVKTKNGKYFLNKKLWKKAEDFLKELKKHEETTDERIPSGSKIFFKNKKEIVFSSKEELDASLTAFSAYEIYGIKILTITNYYYLPKKKLNKRKIFTHSLYVAEKEFEIRHIIFIALFYTKHKKSLSRIKHPILENIKKIIKGQNILKYPSLEEIKDKAEVYNIRVR